jgi:hypothetical protein
MPFQSESQRRYLWANHPSIAEAWAHGKSSVTGKREPTRNTKGHRGVKGGYRNLPRRSKRG